MFIGTGIKRLKKLTYNIVLIGTDIRTIHSYTEYSLCYGVVTFIATQTDNIRQKSITIQHALFRK